MSDITDFSTSGEATEGRPGTTDAWLDAVRRRRSRRSYTDAPITGEDVRALENGFGALPMLPGARVVLLPRAPEEMFTGWLLGVYGKVSSPSAFVVVGDARVERGAAPAGYVGEAAVLEATRLDLGTCWIGGGFRKRKTSQLVELAPDERVYTVVALGYAPEEWTTGERVTAGAARADRRVPLAEIAPSIETELWPAWALAGIELARLAPSARNRQPWRFRLEGDDVVVSYDGRETSYVSKRLDCGIAMLHFELAAEAAGCTGGWEMLTDTDVARWRVEAVEG